MRGSSIVFTVTFLVALSLGVPPGFAEVSTSPGKKAAFETAKGVTLAMLTDQVLTASILKGKRGHVVTVQAMVRLDMPYYSATLALGADVNGNPATGPVNEMNPTGTLGTMWGALQECPGMGTGCTVNGTFILDLDAAEAAQPGKFINQPLTVTLWAGDAGPGGGVGRPVDVSMIVRMEKK